MKKKNNLYQNNGSKKLALNKQKISELSQDKLSFLRGGREDTGIVGTCSVSTCDNDCGLKTCNDTCLGGDTE